MFGCNVYITEITLDFVSALHKCIERPLDIADFVVGLLGLNPL